MTRGRTTPQKLWSEMLGIKLCLRIRIPAINYLWTHKYFRRMVIEAPQEGYPGFNSSNEDQISQRVRLQDIKANTSSRHGFVKRLERPVRQGAKVVVQPNSLETQSSCILNTLSVICSLDGSAMQLQSQYAT